MSRIITVLTAILALTAQPGTAQQSSPGFSESALCPGCSVVLVSFDALQAAHVSGLGYGLPTTNAFDALAEQGVLFTQAISPASWTVPATMSWFTGTYPSLHKVINKFVAGPEGKLVLSNLKELSPGIRTLTEVLKSRGYATGGFTGGAGASGVFGFKQGFDTYFDQTPPFSGMEVSIPKALEWLRGLKGGPFFLFLHGYGIHGQYQPSGGYDRRFISPEYEGPYDGSPAQQKVLRELGLRHRIDLDEEDARFWRQIYDEKIARTDALFDGFLSELRALGLDRNTVFVLASDHGTEQYEHRKFDHGHSLYDELVHVPFAVVSPGLPAGRIVREQVGTIDLMPTVLSLVGVEPDRELSRQIQGRSLVPALTGQQFPGEDVYMETDYRLYTHKRGLRTRDGWKLIATMENKRMELYDLKSDPEETRNLAASRPKKAKELKKRILDHYRGLGIGLDDWTLGCSPVYPDQCH
jgi:arylsulfatase A-like enzyme